MTKPKAALPVSLTPPVNLFIPDNADFEPGDETIIIRIVDGFTDTLRKEGYLAQLAQIMEIDRMLIDWRSLTREGKQFFYNLFFPQEGGNWDVIQLYPGYSLKSDLVFDGLTLPDDGKIVLSSSNFPESIAKKSQISARIIDSLNSLVSSSTYQEFPDSLNVYWSLVGDRVLVALEGEAFEARAEHAYLLRLIQDELHDLAVMDKIHENRRAFLADFAKIFHVTFDPKEVEDCIETVETHCILTLPTRFYRVKLGIRVIWGEIERADPKQNHYKVYLFASVGDKEENWLHGDTPLKYPSQLADQAREFEDRIISAEKKAEAERKKRESWKTSGSSF